MRPRRRTMTWTSIAIGVLVLAGCGGTTARTTTISEAAANATQAQYNRCEQHPKDAAHCLAAIHEPRGEIVTSCEGGVLTNSSCVFAGRVERAFAASTRSGEHVALTVGTNYVTCSPAPSNTWRCRSERFPTWVILP